VGCVVDSVPVDTRIEGRLLAWVPQRIEGYEKGRQLVVKGRHPVAEVVADPVTVVKDHESIAGRSQKPREELWHSTERYQGPKHA
jgi:hypothetical protein